ncbi:hypothetical protein LCGC14_1631230 [marine sediment metagenome]|uniref:Poly A polymerase head domain-containing protein n=1 Tax=marine sediment metagenome TaxID=412755 RepID=A0A0F9L291_9ZZZZ
MRIRPSILLMDSPIDLIDTRLKRNHLIKKIFSCQIDQSGQSGIYLVGGFLRDAFLGIRSNDIDIVVRGRRPRALAEEIRSKTGGTVFDLKEDRTVRVALDGGRTIDVSGLDSTLESDLRTRDFTINSIAWSPERGFIDPYGGIADIQGKIIKANLKKNISNDYLRALRLYRIYSELGFQIDKRTRDWCSKLSYGLKKIAPERITLEFFKLLMGEWWAKALDMALEDNVLECIIPLSYNELRRNIRLVSRLDRKVKAIHIKRYLKSGLDGLSQRGLMRLEGLVLGSDVSSLRITLSNELEGKLKTVRDLYEHAHLIRCRPRDPSDRVGLFKLLDNAGDSAPDLLIISERQGCLGHYDRFVRFDQRLLLSAIEIMSITGERPGPLIGEILGEIRKRRFIGEIRTGKQARALLARGTLF